MTKFGCQRTFYALAIYKIKVGEILSPVGQTVAKDVGVVVFRFRPFLQYKKLMVVKY